MEQKIHFISYGNKKYEKAKKRIEKEVLETDWFDSIDIYNENNLSNNFKEKFKEVLKLTRGGGYWIWKYDIIKQKLENINQNDILIYCDAGCVINKNGKKRLEEYINILNNSDYGIISFQLNNRDNEEKWTTKEILKYFNIENKTGIINKGQYIAGILIMKKNQHLFKILDEFKKALYFDMNLITDKYNKNNQNPKFVDNRHDQSIFSIIRKIYGSIILEDETAQKYRNVEKSPFIAMRKRK